MVHRVLAIVLLLVCGAGCVRSPYPLLEAKQALPVDQRLEGLWETEAPFAGPMVLKVQALDETTYRISDATKPDETIARVRLGKLGETTVTDLEMVVAPVDPSDDARTEHAWAILEQHEGELQIRALNSRRVAAYAKAHPEALEVATDERREPTIKSPRPAVQAFIEKHGQEMKGDAVVRLKRPTTRPTAIKTADGLVHQQLGSYTTRPLTRKQAMAVLKNAPPLPEDAQAIQFSAAQEWQWYEFVMRFEASPASCIAYAEAALKAESDRRESAQPAVLQPIDEKARLALLEALKQRRRDMGFGVHPIKPHWPADWYRPERIEKGLQGGWPGMRVWVDTQRGVLYVEKTS